MSAPQFRLRLCAYLLLTPCILLARVQAQKDPVLPPAQTAPKAVQLSPQAAFEEAMHPFESVHRSIANWSDAEVTAFAIAVKQASQQCALRSPNDFSGDDLISLARLCSLGIQWPEAYTAATKYITSGAPLKPQLTQAYAYQIESLLRINNAGEATKSAEAMLQAVPYDVRVEATINETLRYLQLAYMAQALSLYAARQPILLSRLPLKPTGQYSVQRSYLYEDGLAYAALQQFSGDAAAAAITVKQLDKALASASPHLTPDDRIPIANARHQYDLIGQPLPRIVPTASLLGRDTPLRINPNYGAATLLFLFPDWCLPCAQMGQSILPAITRLADQEKSVHIYGLLAQATPLASASPAQKASTSTPSTTNTPKEETAADILHGTPTLVVSPQVLKEFAANDFPLAIAVDSHGIIRFIQTAPQTAFNAGDFLDQVSSRIIKQWPPASQQSVQASPKFHAGAKAEIDTQHNAGFKN